MYIRQPIIEVSTGKVCTACSGTVLQCSAIGSCIALSLYSPQMRIGGLCHIMLPGRAPQNDTGEINRYAENGIDALIAQMVSLGAQKKELVACCAGAGNVLQRKDDTVCQSNIDSVLFYLDKRNIELKNRSLGGFTRRRVYFLVDIGCIYCGEGDQKEFLLCNFLSGINNKKTPSESNNCSDCNE